MNGFEKHGLSHVSPSQINMFSGCAGAWCARYLFGRKFTFGVAPMVGTLAEDAVCQVILGEKELDEAIDDMYGKIHRRTLLQSLQSKDENRIDAARGMVEIAVEELKSYGMPKFADKPNYKGDYQIEIKLNCNGDGWSIPVTGFCDFVYPEHNLIIDLKTSMKAPSSMSAEHKRQGAIYAKAMGMDVKFLYVTGKKAVWHDVEDIDETLSEVKAILSRHEKFLRLDADVIRDIVPVNKGSFYWSDDLDVARELYGI